MWNRKLEQRIQELETRCRDLEDMVRKLQPPDQPQFAERVDSVLRDLARKVLGDQPQMSYFNERLRSFEFAVLNIKQLGYEFGRQLAETNLQNRAITAAPDTELRSSLCTQADVESDWFVFWCQEMKSAPVYHRKLWELAYICQALWSTRKLATGMSGLGFGCGREVLPSVFAKYGARVLATDLEPSRPEAAQWGATNQLSESVESVRHRKICPDDGLLANIQFRYADMNDIPRDLDGGFDFCWSSCALEHLGSIDKGVRFIEQSLKTLKPGGVAVHTTEFNLQDGDTIDNWSTVLFQKRHLTELAERLTASGHKVAPLDFSPGTQILDGFVDIPPWGHDALPLAAASAHLKLGNDGLPCTSVGLIVTTRKV